MCGIAGWISGGPRPEAERLVRAIVEDQFRRGPDRQVVESVSPSEPQVILGHDRLSIIDLSSEADQPFWSTDGRLGIVFNGEAYNYVELRQELRLRGVEFRTQSDTEVILEAYRAWGAEAWSRLNGMFAFAVYDRDLRRLWLVRDRFGVKPLFVCRTADGVAFASSGRVIARQFGLQPNLEYLARGIASWNFDDADGATPYAGIEQLAPGSYLAIDASRDGLQVREGKWYDLAARVAPMRGELRACSPAEAAHRVRQTLASSVELRLRADVPVAVALSGGLDSATVAGLLARDHPEVKAFTFGSPDDSATEGPLAGRIARQAGIDIRYVMRGAREVADAYLDTLEAQDAPFVSGAQAAHLLICRAVNEEGYRVLLGGQGGDEAFMGYRKYFLFAIHEGRRARRFGDVVRYGGQLASVLLRESGQWATYWKHRKRFQSSNGPAPRVFGEARRDLALGGLPAWQRQMLDITHLSLPTLLRYEDRNSMACSIESRLPFLDYRVVELGLSLPEALKLQRGYGKWVVREAMAGIVPDEVRWARYKIGFATGQDAWLAAGLGDQLRRALAEHRREVAQVVPVDENAYSDERLRGDVHAVPELLALIWLGRRLAARPVTVA